MLLILIALHVAQGASTASKGFVLSCRIHFLYQHFVTKYSVVTYADLQFQGKLVGLTAAQVLLIVLLCSKQVYSHHQEETICHWSN